MKLTENPKAQITNVISYKASRHARALSIPFLLIGCSFVMNVPFTDAYIATERHDISSLYNRCIIDQNILFIGPYLQ